MDRSLKGYRLPVESIRRNMRITRKRSRGERPYSVIKTIFQGGHVFVTTVPRVRVKCMFMGLGHNLMCMIRMKKKKMTARAMEIPKRTDENRGKNKRQRKHS